MPTPPKTFTPPDFTIDQWQTNITLSDIKVTLYAGEPGSIIWSVSADQYNRTHATGTPNNGTVYVYLTDAAGGVIPSSRNERITISPGHTGCREQGHQVWQGTVGGFPDDGNLLATIAGVKLACERITYGTANC
jgi:hypothetical protein